MREMTMRENVAEYQSISWSRNIPPRVTKGIPTKNIPRHSRPVNATFRFRS